MARTDHSSHDHPATPAARAACRKKGVTPPPPVNRPTRLHVAAPAPDLVIHVDPMEEVHCSECGRGPEGGEDEYSSCCNEPLVADCRPYANGGSCHHR